MKIPATGNYTKLTETAWVGCAPAHKSAAQKSAGQRFDSILISTADAARGNAVQMRLRGQLVQEVRAATTSGDVQKVREQIENGSYHVEPAEIARKMLLIMEA